MTALTIDARCTACGLCLATCPERALAKAPKRPRVDQAACTACLLCIEVCPVDAITIDAITIDAITIDAITTTERVG